MQLINEKEIIKPNLPQHKVKKVLINRNAADTIDYLQKSDIECIQVSEYSDYLPSLKCHPDMQFFSFGQGVHFVQNMELKRELSGIITAEYIDDTYSSKYPFDVKFNGAVIGNKIICNEKTISRDILDYAYINNYIIINTNQGYTKCSICVVNENSIITDDISIYKSVQNYFDDVLLISKGSVKLKGMDYGFIGGCTGKISSNEIAFNGRIESHDDYKSIIDFISAEGCIAVETNNERLEDIGSIIPITEISA